MKRKKRNEGQGKEGRGRKEMKGMKGKTRNEGAGKE